MTEKLPPFLDFANSRLPLKNYPFRESGYVLIGSGGWGGVGVWGCVGVGVYHQYYAHINPILMSKLMSELITQNLT